MSDSFFKNWETIPRVSNYVRDSLYGDYPKVFLYANRLNSSQAIRLNNLSIENFWVSKNVVNDSTTSAQFDNLSQLEPSTIEVFENSTTNISHENSLNNKRMQKLQAESSRKLLRLLREQDFEYGFNSPADEMIQELLAQNAIATKQWLNNLFITHYSDVTITTGLLRIISHLDYDLIAPQGPSIALAALANSNIEVRECGIRAFESWVNSDSLQVLKGVTCPEAWLNDYLNQVISDLTVELAK